MSRFERLFHEGELQLVFWIGAQVFSQKMEKSKGCFFIPDRVKEILLIIVIEQRRHWSWLWEYYVDV